MRNSKYLSGRVEHTFGTWQFLLLLAWLFFYFLFSEGFHHEQTKMKTFLKPGTFWQMIYLFFFILYSFSTCSLLDLFLFFTRFLLVLFTFFTCSLLILYMFSTRFLLFLNSLSTYCSPCSQLVLHWISTCSLLNLYSFSTHSCSLVFFLLQSSFLFTPPFSTLHSLVSLL